jgi:CBS domain-containing protein
MTVSDIMNQDVLSVPPNMLLKEAFAKMSHARIRHLPVVKGGRLAGIVSDRDIRLLAMQVDSVEDDGLVFSLDLDTTVRDVMHTDPIVIGPDVDLHEAIDMFIEEKVGAIPVVDEADHLLGIIGYIDLLELLQERL